VYPVETVHILSGGIRGRERWENTPVVGEEKEIAGAERTRERATFSSDMCQHFMFFFDELAWWRLQRLIVVTSVILLTHQLAA